MGDGTTPVTVRHKANEKTILKNNTRIFVIYSRTFGNCIIVNGEYEIILKYFKINFLYYTQFREVNII